MNIDARGRAVADRLFEPAVAYAEQRSTFGKRIAQHQAAAFKVARMAAKIEASRLLMTSATQLNPSGKRNDVEAGTARQPASEDCAEVTQEAFRNHGGDAYTKEFEVEQLMRKAPLWLITVDISEIEKTIISLGLLKEYRDPA